jgi:hypothetical protein
VRVDAPPLVPDSQQQTDTDPAVVL